MQFRFAGFELDQVRAELRGPDGGALRLRPKTFAMLAFFVANAGRVLSKQELMDAVWPSVHVGDDSLFQCIRELRTALDDEQRTLVKLVSGRGYLFTPEVDRLDDVMGLQPPAAAELGPPVDAEHPSWSFAARRWRPLVVATGFCATAVVVAAVLLATGAFSGRKPPTIAVIPLTSGDGDGDAAALAAGISTRLADGLARIDAVRVLDPSAEAKADIVLSGELHKADGVWEARGRLTRRSTGEVLWTAPVSVSIADGDLPLQRSRLVAGLGHPLALRLNALFNSDPQPSSVHGGVLPGSGKDAIAQALASITETSHERFAAAQTMLERALGDDPADVDLAVALAGLKLRGVQMGWYAPSDSQVAQADARATLEHALKIRPSAIPVLEAYCRFLTATNDFSKSLVACSRALDFDPWDGQILYHIGLAEVQLGRFDDALATFEQADRFDTPAVSRWTWRLGAGWTCLLMGRSEDAVPWLKESIAITPASGRSFMLLAAADMQLGRPDEARVAMDRAKALRPGSTLDNVMLPETNAGSDFIAASERLKPALIAAGLPEH